MKEYTVIIAQNGAELEDAKSLEEAVAIVSRMEAEDESNKEFEDNYYQIKHGETLYSGTGTALVE